MDRPPSTPDDAGTLPALALVAAAIAAGHRDPYDPAVPLVLAAGPLAGRPAPGLARCAAIGLSPLSGGIAETRAEGPFGAALYAATGGMLALTGRAETPSYLVIDRGAATRYDATDLWGTDAVVTTDRLAARHHTTAIAAVGPAAERGTRYATILTARHFPLPRLGLGAVLASRNIKAIVCLPGTTAPEVADPDGLRRVAAAYEADQPANALAAWQHEPPGFGAWPGTLTDPGYSAVRNFSDTGTLPVAGLRPDALAEHLTGHADCPDCPTRCIKLFDGAGLHQEAIAALGPNLGIDDLSAVLAANAACQRLGLDPVSAGATLACLFEAGLPPHWRAPAPVGFGRPDSLVPLLHHIATGDDDLADALRQGATELATRLGAPHLAMAAGGVEIPPFDPRIQPGLGLGYAVAPIGPRYDICEHDLDFDTDEGDPAYYPEVRRLGLTVPEPASVLDAARADRTAVLMALWSALDALMICPYASTPTRPLTLSALGDLVRAVTGTVLTVDDLLELGYLRLRRQYEINTALGLPEPENLPRRLHTEPVATGRYAGSVLDPDAFAAAARRLRTILKGTQHG